MSFDGNFPHADHSKPKLTSEQCTGEDLKRYLILVFGTYRKASQAVGISESRLHQLFMGYDIPQNPDIIKRLAFGWNVDIVLLTKILGKLEVSK